MMISYLIGKPLINVTTVTMLVGGVGYEVHVTADTLQKVSTQPEVALHIYTHVREEALELFGFIEKGERELFLLLLSVSGVGPKTALGILNQGADAITLGVQNADTAVFSRVSRVGKKLAQKIIIELRGKLGSIKELELGPLSTAQQEVYLALESLGYTEASILPVLREVEVEKLGTAAAVKMSLKKLSKSTNRS